MFPQDDTTKSVDLTAIAVDTTIYNTLKFDFDAKEFVMADGRCKIINDVEAIKQWVSKFIYTTLNKVPIYKGKKIGTTLENIKGHKVLNNGFIESELDGFFIVA